MGIADDVIGELDGRIEKSVEDLRAALATVRTEGVGVALLGSVRVDYYGTPTAIDQVATVTVVDPLLITIKPWEQSMVEVIAQAINAADLGVEARSDSDVVRVPSPRPGIEERRRDLTLIKQAAEKAQATILNERRDALKMLEDLVAKGALDAGGGKEAREQVQAAVDQGVKLVHAICADKEKDVTQV